MEAIERSSAAKLRSRSFRPFLRVIMIGGTLLFCAALNFSYEEWISPVWSYEGFTFNQPRFSLLVIGYILSGIVCVCSPLRIRRPSQVLYWFLFLTAYIPGLFIPLYLQLNEASELLALQVSLSLAMLIIAIFCRIELFQIRVYPVNPRLFWGVILALYLVGHASVLYGFRGNLHLVGIQDVYSVRFPAKEFLRGHAAFGYISQFLGFVINPLLMAYGLRARLKLFFALGMFGEIALYSTAAGKALILAPVLLVALYITMKLDRGGWVPKTLFSLSAVFLILTPFLVKSRPGPLFNLGSVILVRTFAVPGAETGEYQYFFGTGPHTYLSHVSGINLFVADPYLRPLGEEVGIFFGRKSKFGYANANANLFAMDGIAGFGLVGIPFMGGLCGLVFWGLDSSARMCPLAFSIPALTMIILSITNVSLFTTLLGNGLFAWIVLFILMPRNLSCPPGLGTLTGTRWAKGQGCRS